jgi:hypothetical protein
VPKPVLAGRLSSTVFSTRYDFTTGDWAWQLALVIVAACKGASLATEIKQK